MKPISVRRLLGRAAGGGGIIVFFIAAFEVMIMISPFAFFFYSVFNPIFKFLDQYAATRWLTGFFLPHMVLPPTLPLQIIRVLGSVFFIVGALTFIVCALQIYVGKIFRWGAANKGLYAFIRHPQYLALGIWGLGMTILWPRFIVLTTLSVMFILYFFLAKDEERRMLARHGDSYSQYMKKTGMFFPLFLEKWLSRLGLLIPAKAPRYAAISAVIVVLVVGAGFVCRAATLGSIPFQSNHNITLFSILPEDNASNAAAAEYIVTGHAAGKLPLLRDDADYVGYLMPADYIMQGMIADTGGEFHLFKQHNTVAMITDWVLNPFEHLRTSPSIHMAKMHNVDPAVARRHHCPLGINKPDLDCKTCPYRRVIILEVHHTDGGHLSGSDLMSLQNTRVPVYAVDIDIRTGEIVNVIKVGRATAWEDVPTPDI